MLVAANGTGSHTATVGPDHRYDFSCYGPNGFLRRYAGTLPGPGGPSAQAAPGAAAGGAATLALALGNDRDRSGAVHPHPQRLRRPAADGPGRARRVRDGELAAPDGWYDVSVSVATNPTTLSYRFAGRIEAT